MTTNYFEMGFPENKVIDYLDKEFPKGKNKYRGQAMVLIALTKQSERQNMIKMIERIIQINSYKERREAIEQLKSKLQSPVAQNSKEDTSELHENGASAVMPSGLQTQECYICHNRDLTGTKLKCPNCGNNSQENKQ